MSEHNELDVSAAATVYHDPPGTEPGGTPSLYEQLRRELVENVRLAVGELARPFVLYTEDEDGGVETVHAWGLALPGGFSVTVTTGQDGRTPAGRVETWEYTDHAEERYGAGILWLAPRLPAPRCPDCGQPRRVPVPISS